MRNKTVKEKVVKEALKDIEGFKKFDVDNTLLKSVLSRVFLEGRISLMEENLKNE